MQLSGKVAVITGGAGVLGLATARVFLENGANVMLVDNDSTSLRTALAGLASKNAEGVVADVTQASAVQTYTQDTLDRFGKIDLFFNNAGIEGEVARISEYSEAVFDRVMAINVRGVFLGMKYVLPKMTDGGSVIITSSVAGFRGTPGFVAYTASKHAVVGIMKSTALDAAPRKIRVNTIHPGMVESVMMRRLEEQFAPGDAVGAKAAFTASIKLGRYVRPEEVAQMVLYLASDASAMVTGSEFVVDGGFLL